MICMIIIVAQIKTLVYPNEICPYREMRPTLDLTIDGLGLGLNLTLTLTLCP